MSRESTRAAGDKPGRVVVVVPTYNERESLPDVVSRVLDLPVADLFLLIVDDNSPDGTGQVAEELAACSSGRLVVVHRPAKQGLGRAYVDGMAEALALGADVVVQMDADLSHPVALIPGMLETLRVTGAAVVVGSRYVPGGSVSRDWPWRRRALSRWANAYVNAVLRLGVKDATSGFKAWRASTLDAIEMRSVGSDGYAFQVEMDHRTVRAGLAIVEVPIHFRDRAGGVSKMTWRVQLESALMPWALLVRRRGRVRELLGFGMVGLAALAVQLGVFNLCIHERVGPMTANAVAMTVSVAAAYLGNRYVSFGHRRGARVGREAGCFVVVNLVAFAVAELMLSFAYLDGAQRDRIELNVLDIVGIALGTVLRFWAYRRFVFRPAPVHASPDGSDTAVGGRAARGDLAAAIADRR